MFKAKLIEDESFYKHNRQLLYILLFSPLYWVFTWTGAPGWLAIIILAVAGVGLVALLRTSRKARKAFGKRQIELSEDAVRIKSLKTRAYIQEIDLSKMDSIEVDERDKFSDTDVASALHGTHGSYSLVIRGGSKPERFDFMVDSHYQFVQYTKVIEAWKGRGLPVVPVREDKPALGVG